MKKKPESRSPLEDIYTREDWVNYIAKILGQRGGTIGGKSTSKKKQEAARRNGKKGGRKPNGTR